MTQYRRIVGPKTRQMGLDVILQREDDESYTLVIRKGLLTCRRTGYPSARTAHNFLYDFISHLQAGRPEAELFVDSTAGERTYANMPIRTTWKEVPKETELQPSEPTDDYVCLLLDRLQEMDKRFDELMGRMAEVLEILS